MAAKHLLTCYCPATDGLLLVESGGPVEDDGDRTGRNLRSVERSVEDEALAVGRDIVGILTESERREQNILVQDTRSTGFQRLSRFCASDIHGH